MTQAAENPEINTEQSKRSAPQGIRAKTEEYFSRLRLRVKLGFLAAFLIPPIALSPYFHFQFNSTLKESGKLHLVSLAESQKNTIDLFLQERVVNIFSLFHSAEFDVNPSQEVMDRYLQTLRQTSDAFIDVGFCDSEGSQIGYAGPFTYLLGKDYGSEDWFVAVMEQDHQALRYFRLTRKNQRGVRSKGDHRREDPQGEGRQNHPTPHGGVRRGRIGLVKS